MQNKLISSISQVAFVIIVLTLTSCEKEIAKKPFLLKHTTFYRISPKIPEPVVVNGVTYVGAAYFPGGGQGSASHLGKSKSYFNQHVYSDSPEGIPLGSVSAPVRDVPSYPTTGGPLPLIQNGDFNQLALLNTSLRIPASVYGHIVNTVVFNSNNDAVFFSSITGTSNTFPISETIVGFTGKALIVGGRGRFSNATGEIDYNGHFNLINPNDASYEVEGWISY